MTRTDGNRLQLLIDGTVARRAMIEAVDAARERVWLETFILIPDAAGRLILEAVERAARRGVEVILVADHAASSVFSMRRYRPLERAGARVLLYNPLPPWRGMGRRVASMLHRDHRKLLIADEVGFTGGHNISTRYLTSRRGAYYDMTLRLEGPCVRQLGEVFLQTLAQTAAVRPESLPNPGPMADGVPVEIAMLDRLHGLEGANRAMRELLRSARSRCYMMSAYFFPSPWLIRELGEVSSRGVDVRVMLIGKSDMPFVRAATSHLYGELLEKGVRVFEMWERMLHAKMTVVDGERFILGSFDFNRFSAQHSLEVMVSAADGELATELERAYLGSTARCREITLEDWRSRGPLTRAVHGITFGLLDRASKPAQGETPPPVKYGTAP